MARHDTVLVPTSRMKLAIAKILKEEGFISDYEVLKSKLEDTQMIKIAKPYIAGYHIGDRTLYRQIFSPSVAIAATDPGMPNFAPNSSMPFLRAPSAGAALAMASCSVLRYSLRAPAHVLRVHHGHGGSGLCAQWLGCGGV
jgi:hypothetical protein